MNALGPCHCMTGRLEASFAYRHCFGRASSADDKIAANSARPKQWHVSRNAHRSRRGFTLIELLASSLLTVFLMAAVFTVLKSSFDETRQLAREQSRHPSVWLLEEQLRRDIQNAQGMQAGPNVLRLYGYIATDASTRLPTLTRAYVTYGLHRVANRVVLVREEQRLGGIVPAPPRRDVAWEGVGRLDVTGIGEADEEEDGVDAFVSEIPPDTGGLPVMPTSLQVVLLDDAGQLLLRKTVFHHQEP